MANWKPQNTYDQYRIRVISWNYIGSIYGITLPRRIAEDPKNREVKWTVQVIETPFTRQLIFTSGIDLSKLKKEIEIYES